MIRTCQRRIAAFALGFVALASATTLAEARECEPRPALHAHHVTGEAYGGHDLIVDIVPELRLALFRAAWGWRVAILDGSATDLVVQTPVRGPLIPWELYGWHFRNADNSGDADPAPRERQIAFLMPGDQDHASGTARIEIDEYGLADLGPGERARMIYLHFGACLTWPKSEDEVRSETDFASLDFLPHEEDAMRACGLADGYVLEAPLAPRLLRGDFDGDGKEDTAIFIRRLADDRIGIAVCRAGAFLEITGMDGLMGSLTGHGDFGTIEAWRVSAMTDVPSGWEGEAPSPEVTGHVLVMERFEKALYSLYWDGERFRTHLHYRYVEP